MTIHALLSDIRNTLLHTFAEIDTWFDKSPDLFSFPAPNGGWNIAQILEHIGLTNHFLLILIEKGAKKALNNADQVDLATALQDYTFHADQLLEIGRHRSFNWIRPEHMEPRGEKTLEEVRAQLQAQLHQCLHLLDLLPNGEGALYKTTMTVNDLGKIDVYEYLYFLAQHGQRHLMQMREIEAGMAK